MNSILLHRLGLPVLAVGLLLAASRPARAQAFYSVSKSQGFYQNSSAAPAADPAQPFTFSAQAAVNTTLTLPAGGTAPLTFTTGSDTPDYELNQTFSTKAELDAAYPNGTYKMSGGGIGALTLNLANDNYPAATPQVTSGTWTNGLLVINPAQATTITFTAFGTYATAGVAGHMTAKLEEFNNSSGAQIDNEAATVAVGGITPTTTPLTTLVLPAGTLTSGHVYEGQIQFDTITTIDTTTVAGGVAVAIFTKGLRFYVSAQAAGATFPLPVIIAQPANQTAPLGSKATFNLGVTLGGAAPTPSSNLSILWAFNGRQLDLNNNPKYSFTGGSLVVNNLTAADVGNYSATLIAPGGIVTTNPATLTLGAAPVQTAPSVVTQPESATMNVGSTALLMVTAASSTTPTYQWFKDGGLIAGATSAMYEIDNVTAANAGAYTVVVGNSSGSVTSNPANLAVITTNDPGRLTNLSVLTDISPGVPNFTVGTVIGGSGTSGTKALVVRAGGPALGALGVGGTIADPRLDFYSGQTVIATNDDWGTPIYAGAASAVTLGNAMTSVGAFSFSSGSKDAAVYSPAVQPGNYTVIVNGATGSSGTAIAELYDAMPAGAFTASSPRLINVSVLKQINAGGSLTLGFTIGGSTARTVLIRVIGPGLATLGITSGTLADPQLTLYNSKSVVIATNNDWNADPHIVPILPRVNAFSIGASTKDSMLLRMLQPGQGYTATASGVGGVGGLAIVEVYEVP